MSDSWKLVLSLLAAAVIAGGGAFTSVASDLGAEQDIGDIKIITWVVIAVTAAVAVAKDLQAYIAGKQVGLKAHSANHRNG